MPVAKTHMNEFAYGATGENAHSGDCFQIPHPGRLTGGSSSGSAWGVQAGIAPLVIFTLPLHPLAFSIFMLWQISFNVLGHCGYELYPRWFLRSPLGRFINTTTHHAQHHETNRANFSLYFNHWDRLLGTNHHRYPERFEQVVGRFIIQTATRQRQNQPTADREQVCSRPRRRGQAGRLSYEMLTVSTLVPPPLPSRRDGLAGTSGGSGSNVNSSAA